MPESLLVLCVKAQFGPDLPPGSDRHRVFVWRGAEFEEDEEDGVKEFLRHVMEDYWGCPKPEDQYNIAILDECEGTESDEFNEYF